MFRLESNQKHNTTIHILSKRCLMLPTFAILYWHSWGIFGRHELIFSQWSPEMGFYKITSPWHAAGSYLLDLPRKACFNDTVDCPAKGCCDRILWIVFCLKHHQENCQLSANPIVFTAATWYAKEKENAWLSEAGLGMWHSLAAILIIHFQPWRKYILWTLLIHECLI